VELISHFKKANQAGILHDFIPVFFHQYFRIIHSKNNFMSNVTASKNNPAKKVLVVEDEGEIGLLLNMILNEKDFELDYVSNLLSADEYLQKEEPSVIILDNKLPDGFGVDFISYIKKKYSAIKIIMISGFASAKDVALENGADLFFEKPFSKAEFNKSISQLVC
jgi:two-component system OmpR family response regulator